MRGPAEEDDPGAEALRCISGGPALLAWFGGRPEFGDGEVVGLVLDREGGSRLDILVTSYAAPKDRFGHSPDAIVSFHLTQLIDVALEGFSHQNVISGLRIRPAPEREVHSSLYGIGSEPADHEIELEPCAGAFGTIRATITRITMQPAQNK